MKVCKRKRRPTAPEPQGDIEGFLRRGGQHVEDSHVAPPQLVQPVQHVSQPVQPVPAPHVSHMSQQAPQMSVQQVSQVQQQHQGHVAQVPQQTHVAGQVSQRAPQVSQPQQQMSQRQQQHQGHVAQVPQQTHVAQRRQQAHVSQALVPLASAQSQAIVPSASAQSAALVPLENATQQPPVSEMPQQERVAQVSGPNVAVSNGPGEQLSHQAPVSSQPLVVPQAHVQSKAKAAPPTRPRTQPVTNVNEVANGGQSGQPVTEAAEEEGHMCVICRDYMRPGEDVEGLPCAHVFHVQCLHAFRNAPGNPKPLDACPLRCERYIHQQDLTGADDGEEAFELVDADAEPGTNVDAPGTDVHAPGTDVHAAGTDDHDAQQEVLMARAEEAADGQVSELM